VVSSVLGNLLQNMLKPLSDPAAHGDVSDAKVCFHCALERLKPTH
jgi:hypothetical protein